jgi:hypothetical protein
MHGAEHLHVAPGIQPEAARHAVGRDVDDQLGHALGGVLGEEVEVVQALRHRHLAGVDAVRVGDHTTLLRLAEDVCEAHARRRRPRPGSAARSSWAGLSSSP